MSNVQMFDMQKVLESLAMNGASKETPLLRPTMNFDSADAVSHTRGEKFPSDEPTPKPAPNYAGAMNGETPLVRNAWDFSDRQAVQNAERQSRQPKSAPALVQNVLGSGDNVPLLRPKMF